MNPREWGAGLVLFISILIGASEPMMSERGLTEETAERMSGSVLAEYGQAVDIVLARETPRREGLTGEDREAFALSCANRLRGMAKMATACGAVDQAKRALKAADDLHFVVAQFQGERRDTA